MTAQSRWPGRTLLATEVQYRRAISSLRQHNPYADILATLV